MLGLLLALLLGPYDPAPYVHIQHPDWVKDATLYQINTRQFTKEGTFRAAEKELPRLKALGVDIVWLMPVHPIGQKNRKGTLGSPYSVQDHRKVNPEFGTLADLRHFVDTAHGLGMHVILDWVANHTAWDNPLVAEHPDWYARDWKGDYHPTPWWDWSDIIDLDYSKPGLRQYMTEAMKFWVKDVGVDGFRADAAGFVPLDFWANARKELTAIKPVFMLAEWEGRDLYADAFDASYAWSWWDAVHEVASGRTRDLGKIFVYYSWLEKSYPPEAIRMTFVTNHDKNAWEATEFEAFGPAREIAVVLSVIGDGMPVIYNGQEAGNEKRLAFFEKDPIVWREHPQGELYRALFKLKHGTRALWNAPWGARMHHVPNSAPAQVLSFVRQNEKEKVFALFNFSATPQTVSFPEALHHGAYADAFGGTAVVFGPGSTASLPAWGWKVYVKR